eukprot:scaffold25027_cov69-Skeletonema_dohrnii-CCMP3373.AAC.1
MVLKIEDAHRSTDLGVLAGQNSQISRPGRGGLAQFALLTLRYQLPSWYEFGLNSTFHDVTDPVSNSISMTLSHSHSPLTFVHLASLLCLFCVQ